MFNILCLRVLLVRKERCHTASPDLLPVRTAKFFAKQEYDENNEQAYETNIWLAGLSEIERSEPIETSRRGMKIMESIK